MSSVVFFLKLPRYNVVVGTVCAWYCSLADWMSTLPEYCVTYSGRVLVRHDCVSTGTCSERGWAADGEACRSHELTQAVPDVFLLSCILFLGTFSVAYFLKTFRTSAYFPTRVRLRLRPEQGRWAQLRGDCSSSNHSDGRFRSAESANGDVAMAM